MSVVWVLLWVVGLPIAAVTLGVLLLFAATSVHAWWHGWSFDDDLEDQPDDTQMRDWPP